MQVLHAHWQPPRRTDPAGSLLIWAEDSQLLDKRLRAAGPAPRASLGAIARPHPFASQTSGLVDRLAPLVDGALLRKAADRRALLLLPSQGGRPLPSPGLLFEEIPDTEDSAPPSRALWTVDGAAFAPAAGLSLLLALPPAGDVPKDLALADDLRFWQVAGRLALESLALQKLLPGLRHGGGSSKDLRGDLRACWQPFLEEAGDPARLGQLADAMPAVCRADGALAEAPPARALLEGFLAAACDGLARHWLSEAEIEAAGGRPAADQHHPVSAAEFWLADLLGQTVPESVHSNIGPSSQASRTSRSPRLGPPAQALAKSHAAWIQGLRAPHHPTCRLGFRLQAPEAGDASGVWKLHFLLQAAGQPELSISADAAWRAGESTVSSFGHAFGSPAPTLRASLEHAARTAAAIRPALNRARPRRLSLSTRDAHAFLSQAAPLLADAGYGIEAPAWWDRPGARLGVQLLLDGAEEPARGRRDETAPLALERLVRFHWRLTLGGEPLEAEDFEALVVARAPLIQLGGRWLQLDPFQVEAAARIWQRRESAQPLAEALRFGLGAEAAREGLPIDRVDAGGWLADCLGRLRGDVAPDSLPAPAGLRATLRPYQQRGLEWLNFCSQSLGGGVLADDMGLGKTLQVLAFLLHLREEAGGPLPGRVLLVAPTSVLATWARERERWTPDLTIHLQQGVERPRGADFERAIAKADLVLTSYSLLHRDAEELSATPWLGLVLDEAQRIKNPGSRQARMLRGLDAQWRFALTGTPIENRLSELWSIFRFVLPGYLGPQAAFQREIARPIERFGDAQALSRLRKLCSPMILRRLKRDPEIAAELPPKEEVKVFCQLTPEQVLLYESVTQEAMAELEGQEGMARKGRVLAMLSRLKQVCNHPAQLAEAPEIGDFDPAEAARSGKLRRLVAMCEELVAEGEAALVFTQYTRMGHLLQRHLQAALGRPVLFLHGGQSARLRESLVRRFQDDPAGPPIFVLSLGAGGTGLTLTRASHVFHYDRWWNPAVEDQATDRAYRIGQSQPVTVHKFVCLGTLEERIDAMLESKRELAEQVVGGGEDWLTELSTEDLASMVALRAGARA